MALDDILQLEEPLTDGGIRAVNFFNGRLLASKDMTREQVARREADARLGRAIGDGVAFGLEVSRDDALDKPSDPVLRVRAGLALNRAGQTLRLVADTSVALTRRFAATATACDCVFAQCNPLADGTYVAGAGVYLLTVAPATLGEGRAPTNGLDPGVARCNTDATVEALQFRLLTIDGTRFADLDLGAGTFRNRLVYRCFGEEQREASMLDPWRTDPPQYGLVDELRATVLSDCDVPLALVYWTAGGLQFVDPWAVRRMLLRPDALSGFAFQRSPLDGADLSSFAFIARARRLVEAHAMCAQFQQHLGDVLAASPVPATEDVTAHFRYLPPFGIVPLQGGVLRGFNEASFFANVIRRPVAGSGQSTPFIDARQLSALQADALDLAPTDLLPDDATQREFIWLYRPWQNARAQFEGQSVQPMLAFASGLANDLSTARFDLARFDFSNYANCCGAT